MTVLTYDAYLNNEIAEVILAFSEHNIPLTSGDLKELYGAIGHWTLLDIAKKISLRWHSDNSNQRKD